MGNILDLFNKPQVTQKKTINPFEGWPTSMLIKEIPVGKIMGGQPILKWQEKEKGAGANKYPPTIVVGLGSTGRKVLHQWLDQLSAAVDCQQDNVRIALLDTSEKTDQNDLGKYVRFRSFSMISSGATADTARITENKRNAIHTIFRQAVNRDNFYNWLGNCIKELHGNIRVLIVGSLAESYIGLIGDVLQALHVVRKDSNCQINTSALLALSSPRADLEEGESYAALREIGRFTFSGVHEMEPAVAQDKGSIGSALLEQVLLVEDRCQPPGTLNISTEEFDQGVGQVMTEALFALLHPSSNSIWSSLSNELQNSSESRLKGRQAVFSSIGIATLFVPVKEIEDYVAGRLAFDALFGQKDRSEEGLINLGHKSLEFYAHEDRNRPIQWLKNGPSWHPVFDWLMDTKTKNDFIQVPTLPIMDISAAFQAQIGHGLCQFLNQEKGADLLARSVEILKWLRQFISLRADWVNEIIPNLKRTYDHEDFLRILFLWVECLKELERQVGDWREVLETDTHKASELSAGTRISSSANWREQAGVEKKTIPIPAGMTFTNSLASDLRKKIQASEEALRLSANGLIRRAVTVDQDDGDALAEIEHYYVDSIRPELSHHGMDASESFKQVRYRLGWWIDIKPSYQPQLFLICLPPEIAGEGDSEPPPEKSRFSPDEVIQLRRMIIRIARSQVEGKDSDLCGRWFLEQLKKTGGFLSQAQAPLLVYNQDLTSREPFSPYISDAFYLIGSDKTMTGDFRKIAFPMVTETKIREVENGEAARLSAMRIISNIPLEAVNKSRGWYGSYGHKKSLHLYPQERNATGYERAIKNITGERVMKELAPALCMALANSELVTLFSQALFCGLIGLVKVNEKVRKKKYWNIKELAAGKSSDIKFGSINLAPVETSEGLFESLFMFAVELPNDEQQQLNPTLPFFTANRRRFKELLKQETMKIRLNAAAFSEKKKIFRQTILDPLKEAGKSDALLLGFANLLEVELDTPQWEGWNKIN